MGLQRDIGQITPVIVEPVSQVDVDPVDLTEANNIRRIGKAGIELGTRVASSFLRDEIENDISEYVNSEATHVDAVNRLPDASLNQALLTEQTGAFADDSEEDAGQADPLVKQAKADVTRLSNAVASGIMTESQLQIRIQQKMRQYINVAPGLASHFRNIYAQTMGDYSTALKATHDTAVARQKAAAAEWKAWTDQGDKLYVDPAIKADRAKYKEEVSIASKAKRDAIDMTAKIAASGHDENQQRRLVRQGMNSYVDNSFFEFRGTAAAILGSPKLKKAEKKQMIQDLKHKYRSLIVSQGTVAGAYSGPELDNLMVHNTTRLDQYISAVDNVEQAKSLKAMLEFDKMQAQEKLYVNNPKLREIESLLNATNITLNIENIPGGAAALTSVLSSLAGGGMLDTGAMAPPPKSKEENDVISGYYVASKKILADYEVNDKLTPSHLVGLYEGPLRRWDASQLPADNEIDGFFDFVSSKDGLKGLRLIDEAGESMSTGDIEFTMDGFMKTRWVPNLAAVLNSKLGPRHKAGVDTLADFVKIELNPTTGMMSFSRTSDQSTGTLVVMEEKFEPFVAKQIRYLNKEVARRYNNIFRAKAHLSNPKTPQYLEASKKLFLDLSLARQK